MEEFTVPAYILGREILEDSGFSRVYLNYGGDNPYQRYWAKKLFGNEEITLEVTKLDSTKTAKNILNELEKNQRKLEKRDICEISDIIKKVGEEIKEDKEFKETENLLSVLYGRAPEVVELETNMLTEGMINNKAAVQMQLGDFNKLKDSRPVGPVYNILAGNAAIVSIQLVYSKIARNSDFAKTASGDPIMAVELARRLGEEDKDIGKSLAVTYFGGNRNDLHEILVSGTNKSVVYGGADAVENIRELCEKYGKGFIDHGPRRALWYINKVEEDTPKKIVEDVIPFEQVACVSPFIAFVNKDNNLDELAKQILAESIDYSRIYPPTPNWHAIREKENYWIEKGAKIYTPMKVAREQGRPSEERKDNYFRVVVLPEDMEFDKKLEDKLLEDSIYRFVFIKPIENEKEVVDYLNNSYLKNYISRVGGNYQKELKEYVENNMPLAESCVLGNVCHVSPNEKHDGYYDLLELIELPKTRSALIQPIKRYFKKILGRGEVC